MASTAVPARSSGRTFASAPPCLPIGVRTASTIHASRINPSAQINPNALDLRVQIESRGAQLAAVTGLLVAAERRCCIERMIRVHPDCAGFQLLRHAMCTLHVVRPDTGGEPEHRVVGKGDGLVFIAERK